MTRGRSVGDWMIGRKGGNSSVLSHREGGGGIFRTNPPLLLLFLLSHPNPCYTTTRQLLLNQMHSVIFLLLRLKQPVSSLTSGRIRLGNGQPSGICKKSKMKKMKRGGEEECQEARSQDDEERG